MEKMKNILKTEWILNFKWKNNDYSILNPANQIHYLIRKTELIVIQLKLKTENFNHNFNWNKRYVQWNIYVSNNKSTFELFDLNHL